MVPIRRRATPVTCFVRRRVRSMRCRPPSLRPGSFPPRSPPPLIAGLFERFAGTTSPSDSSPAPRQLRLLDFLSRPRIAHATGGQARPPRFRRDPFARDVVFDHGRASAPRIAAPHMLPSTTVTVSASATFGLSRLNTHPTQLLCTLRRRRRLPRATLATRRALPLTWAGLPPAGSRQLRLAHHCHRNSPPSRRARAVSVAEGENGDASTRRLGYLE